MAHPEWALSYKQKGTELRYINGRYYLYRISSKYDKERKVTKKITHEMLGKITEKDGFIPKGEGRKQKAVIIPSVKEYGASNFLVDLGDDILPYLKESFGEDWKVLYILAINRLLYQSPLKNNEFLYIESYLSECFGDLKLDKNSLTSFIENIGRSRDKISSFMMKYVTGLRNIIFDATHIFSDSKGCKLSNVGYNSKREFDPQINLIYMFSLDKQMPVYYRIFPGNISGMKALKLSIAESGVTNALLVGDKGFASEENFALLERESLTYIFPLKRDSSYIDYERLKTREYDKAFDGHFLYQGRPIFYYTINSDEKVKRKTCIFYDPKLAKDEEASYLRRIEEKIEGYHIEGYKLKQLTFGTMSMITNKLKENPNDIYVQYKHRMEIETLFDAYKNLLDSDRSYMHSDNAFEAWSFINHISVMLYYKVFNLIRAKDKTNNLSPQDLLLKLSKITKVKIKDKWFTSEINKKSYKLFQELDISVT